MAKEFVDVSVPAWVAETSKREIVSQRGLMARYELKDRRSGEIVAKWYSFSATSFPKDKDKTEKKLFPRADLIGGRTPGDLAANSCLGCRRRCDRGDP